MNYLELFSVGVSLGTTFLTIKQRSIRWPIDITILCINLFIHHKLHLYDRWLFSSVILILDIYGWYNWLYGGPRKTKLSVKTATYTSFPKILIIGMIGSILLYFPLLYIKSHFPFLGALRTIFAWLALWLASKKRQEHWFIWIILNLLAINIYFQKQLYLFAIKYIIYTILNIYGFVAWQKTIKNKLKQ